MIRRPLLGVFALLCVLGIGAPAMAVSAMSSAAPSANTGDIAHDGGLQWGFDRIQAHAAWRIGRGAGVTIAVIDSGVALEHEDLASRLVRGVACRDTEGDPLRCAGTPQDDDGHGTHVAGIAAATAGNGPGIAGVAPDARIMPIKVLFRDCDDCASSGNAEDVVAAIRWAVANGADVINLSLGSTESAVFGPGFIDAIAAAWAAGVVPVIAAGNQFVLTADFGDAPAVVVAATTRDDTEPSYGNGVGNARWAVAAPGGDEGDTPQSCAQNGNPIGILSSYWSAGDDAAYACLSGTSMAAPHVSGALAMLLSAGLGPDQAVSVLRSSAVDIGPAGPDRTFGAGLIDLDAAATAAGSAATTVAPPTTRPPMTSTTPTPTTAAADPTDTTVPATVAPDTTDPSEGSDTTLPAFDRTDEVSGRAILLEPDDRIERQLVTVIAIASLACSGGALAISRRRRLV